MAGISDKALKTNYSENRYKYNGIEYDSTFGLDEYEAFFRDLDPQTGRWWQIDPEADKERESLSPYASMSDDPVFKTDPLGNEDEGCCKGLLSSIGSGIMSGVSWINENLNPVNDVVELVTGRDYNLEGAPKVNRIDAAIGIGLTAVGGKAEGAIVKTVEKAVVNDAVKGTEKAVTKYEVSTADDLAKRSVKGDGLDVHHVSQSQPTSKVIPGYDKAKAPAIALSQAEHKAIPTLKGATTAGSARQQLAKDIKDLRKYTNAPNESLQKAIDLNKKMYPDALKKN